jgi:hypothetical protein
VIDVEVRGELKAPPGSSILNPTICSVVQEYGMLFGDVWIARQVVQDLEFIIDQVSRGGVKL